jgi:hypothetical protein
MTSAVHQVFNTTELVEMILLDDNLPMEQLFVLQRVSKRLQHGIEGSQKLQVKMFGLLACTSQDAKPSLGEEFQSSYKDGQFTLFNPPMGISRADNHLGGSWRKMAIAKVPLTVRVQVDDQYLERLSLKDEDAVMGKLVDILSTWYSDKYQRRRHRYKTAPAPRYRRGLTLLID